MDEVTQQNAAKAEQTAAASDGLSGQAARLDGMVHQLVSIISGSARLSEPNGRKPHAGFEQLPAEDDPRIQWQQGK